MFRMIAISTALAISCSAAYASEKQEIPANRMGAISAEARRSIQEEETKLAAALAACKIAPDAAGCRTKAVDDYGRKVSNLLGQFRGEADPQMGGNNRDCVGDTEADVQNDCENGTVEKIRIPCDNCMDGHGHDDSGLCFLYVCVINPNLSDNL